MFAGRRLLHVPHVTDTRQVTGETTSRDCAVVHFLTRRPIGNRSARRTRVTSVAPVYACDVHVGNVIRNPP
jgi:hypothetical protein